MSFPKQISKRTRLGILVLILLLAVVTMLPRVYGWYKGNSPILVSVEELYKGVEELESRKFSSVQKKQSRKKKRYNAPSSRFNPNEYGVADWMALGLSEKQANVVINFAKRGIRNNDHLKQIFVIDDALFELIKDSTFYPENNRKTEWKNEKKADSRTTKTDINTATKEELMTLPGIGDYYGSKIVEYREKLGGYVSKEQLLELYRFDEEKLSRIKEHIDISTSNLKRININTCSAEDLAKHPYISWNVANSIVKMRVKFQKYTDPDQLLESVLISKELLEKIKPYLSVD